MNIIINKAIRYIIENNPSNHVPYHGIDHLFEVYDFAREIMMNHPRVIWNTINEEALLLACLFHDYNHAGKMIDDNINIQNAIIGLNTFLDTINYDKDRTIIEDIIQATKFPTDLSKEELTIEQKIIQDADMCYLFKDIAIVKLYSGLRNEFGQDLDKFLDGQSKFFDSIKFNTEYCLKKWDSYYYHIRLNEIEDLKDAV
jgi:HD superfamily phosphodiesterase